MRLLEAIRLLGLEKKTRFYQASTSELYGGLAENKNEKVITEVMVAKASAMGIEELRTVIAEPTASPAAAEIAIWRHFGEIIGNRLGDCEVSRFGGFLTCLFSDAVASLEFIGAPTSSLVQRIPC